MKRILIVDDDRNWRAQAQSWLEEAGFAVEVAHNGVEALEAFTDGRPDVCLVDALLPGIDGFKLCGQFRAQPGGDRVPIVMISGVFRAAQHARRAQAEFRLAGYLEKPITAEQLVDAIARAANVMPAGRPAQQRPSGGGHLVPPPSGPSLHLFAPEMIPMEGDVAKVPVSVMYARLLEVNATGYLYLVDGERRKAVGFRKGRPSEITSNLVEETLGNFLLQQNVVTQAQLQRSLDEMATTGRRQGEVLVQMGVLQQHETPGLLKAHAESKLFQAFGWTTGQYSFQATMEVNPTPVPFEKSPVVLLREGVAGHTNDVLIKQMLVGCDEFCPGRATDATQRLADAFLNRRELRFFESLDFRRTLREVRLQLPFPDMEGERLLYWLLLTRAVVLRPPGLGASRGTVTVTTNLPQPGATLPPSARETVPGNVIAPPSVISAAVADARAATPLPGPRPRPPESPPQAPALTPEQRELVQRLQAAFQQMQQKTYFELFGVGEDDAPTAHRRAYLALAKQFHPDSVGFVDVDAVRAVAEKIAGYISHANDVLASPAKRREYADSLRGTGTADASNEVAKILAAENYFYEAEAAAKRKDWDKADAAIAEALRLNEREGEYWALRSWTLFNKRGGDRAAAKEAIELAHKATQLQPRQDRGWFCVALYAKALDDFSEAEAALKMVLEVNPRHPQAPGELRIVQKRRSEAAAAPGAGSKAESAQPAGQGGLLKGLFGRLRGDT